MNSIIRPRRLRRNEAIREMVRENHLKGTEIKKTKIITIIYN